ncbi:hypothetical protein D046_1548B, partial [Vibrio parahaemolyticus V-223/04]
PLIINGFFRIYCQTSCYTHLESHSSA